MKAQEPVELTPRQKKQLEKQERRKKYADLAIQGTNSSSITSKRSVERFYLPHLDMNRNIKDGEPNIQYFKYFVPKAPRRSPCMHRGYWLRLHAIRTRLESILEDSDSNVQIVNLGCGFDPLAFQLLDHENIDSHKFAERFSFLDVDYSDLNAHKVRIIRNEQTLLNIVGPETTNEAEKKDSFSSAKFQVASCNLNDTEGFKKLLSSDKVHDSKTVKVFIAEMSLEYMKPVLADAIIDICSKIENSHFLILEQVMPAHEHEPFARQMLKHFVKNDSPLQTVLKYHTIKSQIQRFQSLGFPYVNAGNLLQLWESVDDKLKQQVESIESFDELEEFHLVGQHYVLCHAVNTEFDFKEPYKFVAPEPTENVESNDAITIEMVGNDINRRFGACRLQDGSLVYLDGANPARLDEIITVDTQTGEFNTVATVEPPAGRMCHTVNSITDNMTIMIGGRKAPGQVFAESWILDHSTNKWAVGPFLKEQRFRHSSCPLPDGNTLVFGGDTKDKPFVIYNAKTNAFDECVVEGYDLRPLVSPTICYHADSNIGAITGGGYDSNHKVLDKITIFKYEQGKIIMGKQFTHPLFQRYGAQSMFLSSTELLLVGGTSSKMVFGQDTSIVTVNIDTEQTRTVTIPDAVWVDQELCLVGSSLQSLPYTRSAVVVAGGATCYGFGSISNTTFNINY